MLSNLLAFILFKASFLLTSFHRVKNDGYMLYG